MLDIDGVFDWFQLPETCLIDRRVPKQRLIEAAPTAADRRRISTDVERLQWRAVLKPDTTGIAPFKDQARTVEELSVLALELRSDLQRDRLVELVHRAIPYYLVLIACHGDGLSISLAQKRWSMAEKSKIVLEDGVASADITRSDTSTHTAQMRAQLPLPRQPQSSLYTVYRGWTDAIVAYRAAAHTGEFSMPNSPEHAERRRDALKRVEMLETEISTVRRTADRERQVAKRADLNLRLQELQSEQATELAAL